MASSRDHAFAIAIAMAIAIASSITIAIVIDLAIAAAIAGAPRSQIAAYCNIQEGLLRILCMDWSPARILICVGNQLALTTLTDGNPNYSEFSRNSRTAVGVLRKTVAC